MNFPPLVKAVYYRFYTDDDKDVTEDKYYVQVQRDKYGNGHDIEISLEEFNRLVNEKVIQYMMKSTTELPKLNEKMPAYCYHNIKVVLYQFNTFD